MKGARGWRKRREGKGNEDGTKRTRRDVVRVVESGVIEVVTHSSRHENQNVDLSELLLQNTNTRLYQ